MEFWNGAVCFIPRNIYGELNGFLVAEPLAGMVSEMAVEDTRPSAREMREGATAAAALGQGTAADLDAQCIAPTIGLSRGYIKFHVNFPVATNST